VPLPSPFLDNLNLAFDLKLRQKRKGELEKKIWTFSRKTGSRRVNEVMEKAEVRGIQACPKGLRHSYAIHALQSGIPLNQVSKWLGHSSLITTTIYATALGEEERKLAARMWK
jgi:integrase/recombinase XerD